MRRLETPPWRRIVIAAFAAQGACTAIVVAWLTAWAGGQPVVAIGMQAPVLAGLVILAAAGAAGSACLSRVLAAPVPQDAAPGAGGFSDLLLRRFDEWDLTPAERDVALFATKGLSTAEIARLRGTSEGTVKAQSNAIYRKAEVASRVQLMGVFIEDLADGMGAQAPDAGPGPVAAPASDRVRTAA